MKHLPISTISALSLVFAACGEPAKTAGAPVAAEAASAVPEPVPEAVNGWREYPLRDGVISIQPKTWRTDVVDVPVPAGKGLEYKVDMLKGEGMVYTITFGELEHPGMMEVEFHGHTPKDATGVGDLMFYSKTGGAAQSGVFTAPWSGIHGWYLKNDSAKDVVVKLELAGFYALQPK